MTSVKTYYKIFFGLLILTVLTVAVAFVDLGVFNATVAMLIAGSKAWLVMWFFMHVRHATHLSRVFVLAGFFWLLILFGHTLSDYLTRDWDVYPVTRGWVTEEPVHLVTRQSPRHENHGPAQ